MEDYLLKLSSLDTRRNPPTPIPSHPRAHLDLRCGRYVIFYIGFYRNIYVMLKTHRRFPDYFRQQYLFNSCLKYLKWQPRRPQCLNMSIHNILALRIQRLCVKVCTRHFHFQFCFVHLSNRCCLKTHLHSNRKQTHTHTHTHTHTQTHTPHTLIHPVHIFYSAQPSAEKQRQANSRPKSASVSML